MLTCLHTFPSSGPRLGLESVGMDETPLVVAHLLLSVFVICAYCVFCILLWQIVFTLTQDNYEQNPELPYSLTNSDEDNIIETETTAV